jgi:glyoxylase-like metal-dependent hydrolase (beta-lactamase superfamily II)
VFGSVRQRVAAHLLDLASDRQRPGGRLVARVSQQELADAAGSVREVVARALRDLRVAEIVATAADSVVILDPARLYAESAGAAGQVTLVTGRVTEVTAAAVIPRQPGRIRPSDRAPATKRDPAVNALTAMSRAGPGSAGPVKAVSVISTGTVQIRPEHPYGTRKPLYWWLLTSRQWTPPRPVNVYVIEYARGLILFDTGQDWASVTDTTYFPGGVTGYLYRRLACFDVGEHDTLTAQLATLGYAPADFSTAILSHLHQDHIGGLAELTRSDLPVSAAEWAELAKPTPEPRGFLRSHIQLPGLNWHRVSPEPARDPALAPFTESLDVMGDGSLVLLPTPRPHRRLDVTAGPPHRQAAAAAGRGPHLRGGDPPARLASRRGQPGSARGKLAPGPGPGRAAAGTGRAARSRPSRRPAAARQLTPPRSPGLPGRSSG